MGGGKAGCSKFPCAGGSHCSLPATSESVGAVRAAERGGPGGLLTLGPVIKHGARAVRLAFFFVCCACD